MVTVLATGKTLTEAPQISQHCALLASNTLKAAVQDYLAMQREPWKKNYRK
jgi:NifU-like protein involved in Fe-S cluster formation